MKTGEPVLYEVNLTVEPEIEREFTQWLTTHIETMLAFDGFQRARWWRELPSETPAQGLAVRYTIHYEVTSLAELETYLTRHAHRMRADGTARFGTRFRASRRIFHLTRVFPLNPLP